MACANGQVSITWRQGRRHEVGAVDTEAHGAVAYVLERAFGPNPDASAFVGVNKLAA